jgi:hypothetical protein
MNSNYISYDVNTGEILSKGYSQLSLLNLRPDVIILGGEGVDIMGFRVENGALVVMPPRPSQHHAFNYVVKQWEDPRTLADHKSVKNSAINSARLQANQGSFTYEGKQIATDPLSRGDIDGAHGDWLIGNVPADWPGGWKTMDNTYVAIPDQTTWFLFYKAMTAQGTANFIHAQALKAQLDAATTPEEVEAVPSW